MLSILICYLTILGRISSHYNGAAANPEKIDPELLALLENGGRANALVFFEGGVQPALDRAAALRLSDRDQRNQAIVDSLKEHMDESQGGVVQTLATRGAGDAGGFIYFKQYWTGNKLFIKDATADTLKAVAEDPKVLKIKMEPIGIIEPSEDEPEPDTSQAPGERFKRGEGGVGVSEFWKFGLYGINITQVKEAWEELGGNKGEGVIVGTIDTGVRYTHESLRDNFVGIQYGWYDAVNKRPEPEDISGHGTHTMGTFVGSYGIGVAPGAKWMTCLSCNETYCPGEALLDCIKFMACPTLPDGSNPDCTKAPQVISNSWVVPRGADDFNEDILHWRAMGIIPVFAIGNKGLGCNTTRAPGENSFVIGVGATNIKDQGAPSSSVGWASDGGIKPDLVAPGGSITSANFVNDTLYVTESGTSMAAPLVAGVVALLKVRKPDLTFDEAYELLTKNTDIVPLNQHPNNQEDYCDEMPKDNPPVPNIFLGYGRVNALKAVKAQTQSLAKLK